MPGLRRTPWHLSGNYGTNSAEDNWGIYHEGAGVTSQALINPRNETLGAPRIVVVLITKSLLENSLLDSNSI
jgi:hypothetical protein